MSYQGTWQYLKQLTAEAEYLKVVRTGHWLWVYDNINVHQKVRHEREGRSIHFMHTCMSKGEKKYDMSFLYNYTDRHSTMLNMTARLAMKIRHLPDWEVDWTDATPQRDSSTLTISDLLPTEDDGVELHKRAVHHVMQFLVTEFSSLNYLESLVPSDDSPQSVSKSSVIPMKILFKDEKYKSETTDILERLVVDADLSGKPEVCKFLEHYMAPNRFIILLAECIS